jgi:CHRD domain
MVHSQKIFAGIIGLLLLAAPALGETMMFKADLKAASEVPPTQSSGQGDTMITLDTEKKTVAWKTTFSGLSGNATAAHFHGPAAPGENAGPAVDISGKIEEGSAPVSDDQIKDLQAGKWYINIHTAKYPDGEIRGQLEMAK